MSLGQQVFLKHEKCGTEHNEYDHLSSAEDKATDATKSVNTNANGGRHELTLRGGNTQGEDASVVRRCEE